MLHTTPLIDAHRALNARLTDFGGWRMPLSYSGTPAEHRAVRQGVGLFDLCHMGRLTLHGPDALSWLERVTPAKLNTLAPGRARYGVVLTESGGIVDDIIVTHTDDDGYDLCVNAANRQAVVNHLNAYREGRDATLTDRTVELAQIAVQGPDSGVLVGDLLNIPMPNFMATASGTWRGQAVTVSRTGYSGELGVELFLAADLALSVFQGFLDAGATPCGLGARDTLRLEMGYPLYGHELSLNTNPVDAGLSWTIDWRRHGWLGEAATRERHISPSKTLYGLMLNGPGIPRAGCAVVRGDQRVGEVTSGNMGLSVGRGIALAYLAPDFAANSAPNRPTDTPDTALAIDVRGRLLPAHRVTPPFYCDGSLRRDASLKT